MQIKTWVWRLAHGCYVGVVKPLDLALSLCSPFFFYSMGQFRKVVCVASWVQTALLEPQLCHSPSCLAWASYLPSVPLFFFFYLQYEIGLSTNTSVQHLESYRAMFIHVDKAWGTGHLGSLVSREMPILEGNSPAGNLAPL